MPTRARSAALSDQAPRQSWLLRDRRSSPSSFRVLIPNALRGTAAEEHQPRLNLEYRKPESTRDRDHGRVRGRCELEPWHREHDRGLANADATLHEQREISSQVRAR